MWMNSLLLSIVANKLNKRVLSMSMHVCLWVVNWMHQTLFRWCKFSHQMKPFCCSSVFLLHDNGVLAPLKPQTFETGFQSAILWNRNLQSGCVNCQTAKPVRVTKLMLMLILAHFNGFRNSHYESLIKHSTVHQKQVEYDDRLLRRIRMFVNNFFLDFFFLLRA